MFLHSVNMYCISVLLGTGVTFATIRLDGLPPNVGVVGEKEAEGVVGAVGEVALFSR